MMSADHLSILQVVPYYYPAWAYGGIPRVVYDLSNELSRRGHNVTVFTTDVLDRHTRSPYSAREEYIHGVRAQYFRNLSNRLAYDHQIYLPLGMRKALKKTIADFDIIHLHGHRNFLNNIVQPSARKHHKSYIFSAHGTVMPIERHILLKRFFDFIFGERILKQARHCIAVSETEVVQYGKMGVTSDRVSVIYNGVDISAFRHLPEKGMFRRRYGLEGNDIILFLGKITPRKGVDFLVRAFSMLQRKNAVLVIAGNDMGYKRKIDRIIAERGLENRIIYTGLLVDDWKRAAYQEADVLVYPSVFEVFGLVPFEALLCGTPVIVADDCGCGEIIGREGIGGMVRYNDDRGLRDAIEAVLNNRQSASERANRGKAFVERTLSWSRIASCYENLYYRSLA